MHSTELGFGFRSIGRGLKKVGGKVGSGAKAVGKGAVKVGVTAVKTYAQLYLIPLKFLVKAARKIGVTLCKAPPQLLELAASQANIDPAFIPLFCTAVRENKIGLGSVRRMLPPALKIAAKMAASGAFPPIVPVLAVVKYIPFVGQFTGAGTGLGSYASDLRNPKVRAAVDTMEILALADRLDLLGDADAAALGLSCADRRVMQGYLAAAATKERESMLPFALVVAAFGTGIYLGLRK